MKQKIDLIGYLKNICKFSVLCAGTCMHQVWLLIAENEKWIELYIINLIVHREV